MLRITIHDSPRSLTFRLEGRLAGPWLRELEDCWRRTLAGQSEPFLRVDLTGVTFIDNAGKECLADLYRQGAEFVAADCLTKAVVAEISPAASGTEVQHEDHRDSSQLADVSRLVRRPPGCPIVDLRVHRLVLLPLGGRLALESRSTCRGSGSRRTRRHQWYASRWPAPTGSGGLRWIVTPSRNWRRGLTLAEGIDVEGD